MSIHLLRLQKVELVLGSQQSLGVNRTFKEEIYPASTKGIMSGQAINSMSRWLISMCEDLNIILTFLHELRREVVGFLNLGLSGREVKKRLQKIGVKAPDSLVAIYSWRNGTQMSPGDSLDDLHFFPGFYLLSLEDALEIYDEFKNDERWDRAWFPVFANGGGDFYAIDCESGEVVGFILGEAEQEVEYESLGTMVKTLGECFEKGIFYVSDEGYLESDDQRHLIIARKHNPRIKGYFA